ncbi:PAS domain S-box protein [Lutibacter citreus]|uniref:PAS domain S-box protein n=1 Tax=Lutibacter citreus TaxID=2138210 RepID=UPI000DBE4BFE|nr:PAS domain S-box protein [Lutibacter citreus]
MGIENKIEESLSKEELISLVKKQEKIIYSLKHDDRKYDNLFNNSLDGIYKSTPEGKFIDVNRALVTLLGYSSKEELMGAIGMKQLCLNTAKENGAIEKIEGDSKEMHQISKKDGSKIWIKDFGEKIYDDFGNFLYYEGIIRNVTDFKRAIDIQKVLLKISQQGYEINSFEEYNKFILEQLSGLLDVSNAYIAFYNEEKETINIPFIRGEVSEREFPVGKSMTGYLMKGKVPLLVQSERYRELIDTGKIELLGVFPKVWMGAPLIIDSKVIGAIVIQSYTDLNAYGQQDLDLLEFVSSYISSAILRSRKRFELRKFSLAVEQSANTIVITNTKGEIEYVNAKFTETSGYTKEEALGINPRILNSGNQDKAYFCNMWELISSGKEWLGEFQNKSKSGRLYWERASITPIKNAEGVITNYMAVKEEITLQKKTEEKLKKVTYEATLSKEVLRNVLDNIPVKVFWKNRESKFLGCNTAFLKENSLKNEDEIIGKSDFDFTNRKDAEKFRADDVVTMLSGKPNLNYQETFIINGKKRWVTTSKLPFFDENNEVIGVVGTSEDITERIENEIKLKKATEEAISANLSKSTFLSNMSHEIRTPMNAILGYSQLLQEDDNLTKNQQNNLKTINKSGEHLLILINDILDMSKIEAGRLTLTFLDFNFIELLKEVEQLFKISAQQKNIDLSFVIGKEVPKAIEGDEAKIKQVIINLIGNSLKFTSKGSIKVSIEINKQNMLEVKVKDTGCGILKEEQSRIFKPFEQAQKGNSVSGGTGLGLAICKKIANLMNGDILMKSEFGVGSEFIFNFKFKKGKESIIKEDREELKLVSLSPEMKGLKLVIVDDRFENRDILYKKFSPLGFDIKMAENGLEAVEIYKEWKPDIIFMDVVMPILNGVEATRQILDVKGNHDVMIFVISASAMESEQIEIMELGATVFIKKPVIFNSLIEELQNRAGVKFIFQKKNENLELKVAAKPSDVPEAFKLDLLKAAEQGDFKFLQELLVNLEKETNLSFKIIEDSINEMEFEEIINWFQ